jgi:hypothetical protein
MLQARAASKFSVMAYKVTLKTPSGDQVIECADDVYILDAAEEAGEQWGNFGSSMQLSARCLHPHAILPGLSSPGRFQAQAVASYLSRSCTGNVITFAQLTLYYFSHTTLSTIQLLWQQRALLPQPLSSPQLHAPALLLQASTCPTPAALVRAPAAPARWCLAPSTRATSPSWTTTRWARALCSLASPTPPRTAPS